MCQGSCGRELGWVAGPRRASGGWGPSSPPPTITHQETRGLLEPEGSPPKERSTQNPSFRQKPPALNLTPVHGWDEAGMREAQGSLQKARPEKPENDFYFLNNRKKKVHTALVGSSCVCVNWFKRPDLSLSE